jgi:hypothetical protein
MVVVVIIDRPIHQSPNLCAIGTFSFNTQQEARVSLMEEEVTQTPALTHNNQPTQTSTPACLHLPLDGRMTTQTKQQHRTPHNTPKQQRHNTTHHTKTTTQHTTPKQQHNTTHHTKTTTQHTTPQNNNTTHHTPKQQHTTPHNTEGARVAAGGGGAPALAGDVRRGRGRRDLRRQGAFVCVCVCVCFFFWGGGLFFIFFSVTDITTTDINSRH